MSTTPRPVAAPGAPAAGATPLSLPAEHFAAALLFLAAGAGGLVWVAPDLAAGLFPLPRVMAVTHLFTLGWITTSILGALYQFLPVALQVPIRSERLAHVSFALYAPGVAVFVAGLLGGWPGATLAGAGALSLGLLGFLANLAGTLFRAPRRDLTWWALAGAGVFLLATVALGLSLALNLRLDLLGEARFLVVGVHLHIALAGWVLMVVIGVAHRLLPMFLLSHGAGERAGKAAAALVGSGTLLLTLAHHVIPGLPLWLPAVLIAGGTAAFLAQAAVFFRHRKRPALDAGLRLAAAGLGLLALGLGLAAPALRLGTGSPRLVTAYVAALVLGFTLFVAGHYYKIVPTLVWTHRFGPLAGKRPVPRLADLYGAGTANAAAGLLTLGALGLVASVLAGSPPLARPAALLIAAGVAAESAQLIAVARRRAE